ncbi:MAG TPA: hypothetical protein ENJ87_12755 [Gammaproteobacteria bacterium]|nr:hypothetical protein [Gammaproteobacteria bacterium]
MNLTPVQKNLFFSILILLITLQTTSCSTEKNAALAAGSNNLDTENSIDNITGISGVDNASVTEDIDPDGDDLLEVSGKLNIINNIDAGPVFIESTLNGNYGKLTIDSSGNWRYAADNNQSVIQDLTSGAALTDSLTVRSTEGETHKITITILGVNESNQPAIITGTDTGSVTEDVVPVWGNALITTGKLNVIDNDDGEALLLARVATTRFGSATTYPSGFWIYAARNSLPAVQALKKGQVLTDKLFVNSIDGTPHTVVITINGSDESSASSDITLSWTAPVEREDNTPIALSEIAGYRIYYGSTPGLLNKNIQINDGTTTTYLFKNFSAGTYYFSVTTLDTDGQESQLSIPVQKNI